MSDIHLRGTTTTRSVRKPNKLQSFVKEHGWSYAVVLPSMSRFTIVSLVPVVWALIISFQKGDIVSEGTFVGFQNYIDAFTTDAGVFVQAIKNTLYYTVITVVANILIAMILAALLQKRHKLVRTIFLSAFYLPAVTSSVIIAIVWKYIFNTENGFFNYFLSFFHIAPVRWLSDPNIVLNSITLSTILTIPATGVVLFNAAMNSVPPEFYEAAQLDGAGPIARWWHITLPLIKSTTLYLVVLYTIASFQVFERVFILIPSGVGNSTQFIVTQIYKNGFQDARYGLAAAQAFILFLMILSVSIVQFRLFKSDVEY